MGGVFDAPEVSVAPSPATTVQVRLPDGVRVIDFDVAATGPFVALLVANPNRSEEVRFWNVNQTQPGKILDLPPAFKAQSIAWHPLGQTLFLAGTNGQEYQILKVEKKNGNWSARKIYGSRQEIRRLVPGPRPFRVSTDSPGRDSVQYRLFFGLRANDGTYSVHSITEEGKIEYQVVGHRQTFTRIPGAGNNPSEIQAASALPVGFHPAGHLLIWEDGQHCFQVAGYDRDYWKKSSKLLGRNFCGGTVSVTPNGTGLLHWTSGTNGVDLLLQEESAPRREASAWAMISTPSSVADGKGIVGIVRWGAGLSLVYTPIDVPLADSVNAWMYVESEQDRRLIAKNGGLFRDLNKEDQLYSLYDTEAYYCGQPDESTPTRPYLVTTDSFWELFAAAYEGIFIVRERLTAIPAFRHFVELAGRSLAKSDPRSPWTRVFAALAALQTQPDSNEEARRIVNSTRSASPVLGTTFDYGELKPRGHYAATPEAQLYFRAFRYLTKISDPVTGMKWSTDELRRLPPDVKAAAMQWIDSYRDLNAPARSPLVWQSTANLPPYVKHRQTWPVLFPLAWGFDNETLYSTTYHEGLPENEEIDGPEGKRLQPSSFDIAAALGSQFARGLLSDELRRYPRLDAALKDLSSRSTSARGESGTNLYQRWIDALAQQWADSVPSPNAALDQDLWRVKRLQTGLASWATLRHATVLVNEREGAECGEGAFEYIVMRPPRGYAEPDPETFGKIARLFDAAANIVNSPSWSPSGNLPLADGDDPQARESLKQGLLHRLADTAEKARVFQAIALKETRGQPLTSKDYEEILYFGRVAEHHFLIFKSLANKDLALSTPNPIPKVVDIADVQGGPPYLMAAVGRPLEWDHTVPFFGRHEIVKGAAYSFYEFSSPTLLNDAEWMEKLPAQPHPAWVAPFVSQTPLSCPPRDPL